MQPSSTPNPLGKGAFGTLRRGDGRQGGSALPAASEKSQILPDPDNPQDLAHRTCDVQPATQGRSTILPREDLLTKKLLPL